MRFPARVFLTSICIAFFAIIAAFCATRLAGPLNRPAVGDALFYVDLAHSMAAGKGYVATHSPWPGQPHLGRLPLWPWLLTLPVWLFERFLGEYAVLRLSAVLVHGICCALLTLLTFQVWRDWLAAAVAGFLLAVYAPAISLTQDALSEPAFLCMALAGMLLLCRSGWQQAAGAGLAGLAALSRANFVLFPFALALAAVLWRPHFLHYWKRMAVLTAIFLLPATGWVMRNYYVSGVFPLLTALEGEAFYGANNDVVKTYVKSWGFYAFPDDIPGEKPKQELAKHMNEAELDHYYRSKGLAYARANWFIYPNIILGRFVRAFIPLPISPTVVTYLASLERWLLYGVFVLVLRRRVIKDSFYGLSLTAFFLITVATVALYYGTFRFAFPLEALMIPSVGALAADMIRARSSLRRPAYSVTT